MIDRRALAGLAALSMLGLGVSSTAASVDWHDRRTSVAPTLSDLAARGQTQGRSWTEAERSAWRGKVTSRVRAAFTRATSSGSAPSGKLVVRFTVMPDGRISSVGLIEGSGKAKLDRIAVQAIRGLGRLPPVPNGRPNDVTAPLRVVGGDE